MSREGGFSLLEVLISSALLATALLGLATLALRGMEDAAASRDELVAGILLRDLEGRVAVSGLAPDQFPASGFAQRELTQWQTRVTQALPGGRGLLCLDSTPDDGSPALPACDGAGRPVTKIFWKQPLTGEAERRIRVLQS